MVVRGMPESTRRAGDQLSHRARARAREDVSDVAMFLNRSPNLPLRSLAGFRHDLLEFIEHDERLAAVLRGEPLDSVQNIGQKRDFGAPCGRFKSHAHRDLSVCRLDGQGRLQGGEEFSRESSAARMTRRSSSVRSTRTSASLP